MKFGIVGLGRMGTALARQALEKKHEVVGYDRSPEATKALEKEGLTAAFSLDELAQKLQAPRIVLLYLPHGNLTDSTKRSCRRYARGQMGGGIRAREGSVDSGDRHVGPRFLPLSRPGQHHRQSGRLAASRLRRASAAPQAQGAAS